MTTYLTPRREVIQARQYQGPTVQEFQVTSISGWISSINPGYSVASFSADAQGFSVTIDAGVDGVYTVSGAVGDWLLVASATVEKLTTDDIVRRYENI